MSIGKSSWVACWAATLVFTTAIVNAQITLQNDSGAGTVVCTCFVPGEEAAVWLTSPCAGTLIAVQIGWGSAQSGAPDSLEQAIHIYEAGNFPTPGPEITVGDLALEGPVLVDGFINEFNITEFAIPISTGETIVVSLEFANANNTGSPFIPSVVHDGDGCQPGKSTVFAIPPNGWFSACVLGVSGDWLIRAVVDCGPTGACCDMENCSITTQSLCETGGGAYEGDATDCSPNPCVEPTGACCLAGGPCIAGLTESQ